MVSLNSLGVEFSARPLFSDVSFVINRNDRIALVGKNGAGKSTMLKILAGRQQPATGSVTMPSDITIGYLPQQMTPADETSLVEETRKAFSSMMERRAELDRLNAELSDRDDYESESYAKLLDRIDALNNRIAVEQVDNMEADMERTLLGLGFNRSDFNRPTSEFSGGWRMRIELAKLLLRRPDLLLLDEPTNHLDIESIQWLEQFLAKNAGAVLLVSHDRAFLDNVTNRTVEINCGKIYDYRVSYTEFVKLRAERIEQQMRAFANQQKQIADIKDFIKRPKPCRCRAASSSLRRLCRYRSTRSTDHIFILNFLRLHAAAIFRSFLRMWANAMESIRCLNMPHSPYDEAKRWLLWAKTERASPRL